MRRAAIAIGVVVMLGTAGCGSRLSRDEVLSAARAANAAEPAGGSSVAAAPEDTGSASEQDSGGVAAPEPLPGEAAPAPGATVTTAAAPAAGATPRPGPAAPRAAALAPAAGPAASTPNTAAPPPRQAGAPRPAPAPAAAAPGPGGPAPAASPAAPAETGPIVIASVGNYSGAPGVAQAPIAKGVQVWAASVNRQGGLLGRQVKVIVVDDGSDPARHLAALRDLVENQKVVAFVGNGATLTAAAGRDYLEKVAVPVIGSECTTPPLYWESPIFFTPCANYPDQMYGLAKTAKDFTNETQLAFLYCQEAQTCRDADNALVTQDLAGQAGIEIVYRAQVSLVQPDFTSECINARQAGAKLMIAIITPDALSRLASSCARQSYRPTFVQWAATTLSDSNTKPGLENMVLQTLAHPFPSTAAPAVEVQRAFSTFAPGRAPGPPEMLGWASSKMFELVATRANDAARSVSPKTVVDALHTVSNETLGGLTTPLTFPAGSGVKNSPCWFVATSKDSKWTAAENGKMFCR